ncbi:MAG: DUF488 domain-containing protein [Bacteroidetes bacterium]|nr:DUF488 domain-containing protein [Bacteroidota bacterium]
MKTIKIKRIYDTKAEDDGYRILIDRLWPRGVSKKLAELDEWNKEVTPTPELRKWFAHDPEKFEEFKSLYQEELRDHKSELKRLKSIAASQNLTLLYAAKDPKINHAIILLDAIKKS